VSSHCYKSVNIFPTFRYEAQLEKDWQYILEDSDSKLLIVATEAIYEKCKDYPGKVRSLVM
jgi:long-subunit acyl-CoA synthetase (AMP-forming)